MAGGQGAIEHVEHKKPSNGGASGSNSPQSLYFEEHKLKDVGPGHPELQHQIPPHIQQEHGALIDHHVHPQEDEESHPELWWSKVRHICQEAFSEFFGVFILILFGDGVVAQVVLSSEVKGDYQSINWGEY